MNLLLMGMRASGKTTVGRILADRLGKPFIDLDEQVLRQFDQTTVREVWAAHGESSWRDAEARALADTLAKDGQVIALGGGAPMYAESRRLLDQARSAGLARIVYLQCSATVLQRRLRIDPGDRPGIMMGESLIHEVPSLLSAREQTYSALADVIVNAEVGDPESVAEGLQSQVA